MTTKVVAGPDPGLIFEILTRYQETMALKGAIELELFTHIADGATTTSAIAARCKASERGVRTLCDFLTVMGLLTKQDGAYGLTQDSAVFLNKRSPAYLGSAAQFIVHEDMKRNFSDIAALVRKGHTLYGDGTMGPEDPIWVEFARSMAPMAMMTAQMLGGIAAEPGRKMKVLDIAAGHGLYGIAIAKANPAAEVYAVDWKNVLTVALENAEKAGVASRYHTIPGSAFDVDFGTGYNLVMLPNFLHHFDAAMNVKLLKKIRAAMNPGARLATVEFVPNDDRVSPAIPARFSMVMLGNTEGGDAYTFAEFDAMFRQAGFGETKMQDMEPSPQRLLLTSY